LLLANGAEVNAKIGHGKTPLRRATEKGHSELAAFLRERGGTGAYRFWNRAVDVTMNAITAQIDYIADKRKTEQAGPSKIAQSAASPARTEGNTGAGLSSVSVAAAEEIVEETVVVAAKRIRYRAQAGFTKKG